MSAVLGDKDVNATMDQQNAAKDVKSMEYHRQVFQSKMAAETYVLLSSPAAARQRLGPRARLADAASRTKQYVSPSDNIMSPCTAKINALRNKHASKAKPKSLFAQASVKKLNGENALGARSIQQ
ncbi:spo12-like protein [Metarhizium guizhouense ARSEF 977]|uniref:Spo12-like protein n=1 Tax=Metarhizium guizhouense (strain ARSEF 977) TaxID=1276136 RepID=A0A0B4H4A7_METGA|nr:spo12-like protein [Metarhizium guizhouense ARSEF 977]